MVPSTPLPTRAQLVERAAGLVPLLRANAGKAAEDRRLTEETIDALADAGIFKLRVPARFGGYEADTTTLMEVAAELGRGDGSASWVASVYSIPGWMVCMFPEQVQEEVFSTPDVRVCGTLSPTAFAKPVAGGFVVNGKWSFISGAPHAHWQEIIAILDPADGSEPYPLMALVPMADLQVVDDWYATGLKGSGSLTTIAQDLFVPAERALPMPTVVQGNSVSERNARIPIYRAPLVPVAGASTVGTLLGLARAAKENFLEWLPGRRIAYTAYTKQSDAAVTHLQVAEASQKIDQAEFHAWRITSTVDRKAAEGVPWTLVERARNRADVGEVCKLAKEAVDILAAGAGGASIYQHVPIQGILHDLQAASLHALINPTTAAELYGRILCGLEPDTAYI
ncbi:MULTISPECIES: acyl-CoA dehydrogenase family protein [unclassified Amycolatopsis]|uniref:acyl-CoA dehydrogenase family protein n=1 Tax=unclassified Amycolatopsis TaxID=2618356 RepID=UPI002E2227DA|nr:MULTISPECIES: acyl-CoA dehydrogenase family protein [unclassified Amycolatopsis]